MEKQEKQEKEESYQEFLYKLSIFEKNIEMLNQQLQLIEKNLIDLSSLNFGMDEIKGSVGKEILAQLGRGIFVKTKLTSEDLIVDVGDRTFVKKTIAETKKILKEQIEKLNQIKKELEEKIEEIEKEVAEMVLNSSKN